MSKLASHVWWGWDFLTGVSGQGGGHGGGELHGTTSLFAALDAKAGTVIGRYLPRHRAQEFRRFSTVENSVPADLDVNVILDNASSHKT